MKKKQRILVLLLSFVFAFTLFAMAACGEDEKKPTEKASISLNPNSVTLTVDGESKDVTATVTGTKSAVKWSIDKTDIATIQFEGKVCRITPKAQGTATVTATVDGKTATCAVTVNPKQGGQEQEHTYALSLDKSELQMKVGDAPQKLAATAKVDGKVDDKAVVTWESKNTAIATVSDDGTVTAVAAGTAEIVAAYQGKTAKCTVTVSPADPIVVTVELDREELDLVAKGAPTEVRATVTGSEETVVWSLGESEDAIVGIAANGNTVTVTPLAQGTATLTATLGEGDDAIVRTVSITVAKAPVTIALDEESIELDLDDTTKLKQVVTATVENAEGEITWTTGNSNVATVEEGNTVLPSVDPENNVATVTAVGVGRTTLTASVDGVDKTIEIVVHGTPTGEVTLTLNVTEKQELTVGGTLELSATVEHSVEVPAWTVSSDAVTLSSATGTAVTVTAAKEGTATVTVTLGEGEGAKTATLEIDVWNATAIELDKTAVELVNDANDEAHYSAQVTANVEGKVKVVTWEIVEGGDDCITLTGTDTNTVTVTAKAAGTATVRAYIGEVEQTFTVTVKAPVSVTLDPATLNLKEGGADGEINVTVEGTEEQFTYAVTGDQDSIEVTQDGNKLAVRPLKTGTATVTVSVGGKTAECAVTVEGMPVIEFTSTDVFGEDGGTIWHKGIFAANELITKDTTVDAIVFLNGTETPVHANIAQLEASLVEVHVQITGSKYDSAEIYITFKNGGAAVAKGQISYKGVREAVISDEEKSISLAADDKTATVSIISVNGKDTFDDSAIVWTIADTEGTGVATIPASSTGKQVVVTGVAAGKATLTATIGEGEDAIVKTCVITVVEGQVEEEKPVDVTEYLRQQEVYPVNNISIRLGKSDVADIFDKLNVNKNSVEVTVAVDGADPVPLTVIHNVYSDGANIYIQMQAPNDWTHDYVFAIKYKNAAGKVIAQGSFHKAAEKSFKLSGTSLNLTLKENETVTGTVTATINSAVQGEIAWTIDDTNVATIVVSEDKLSVTVTAVAAGKAIITAEVDGMTKTCAVNVTNEGEGGNEPALPDKQLTFNAVLNDYYGGTGNAIYHDYISLAEITDNFTYSLDNIQVSATLNGQEIAVTLLTNGSLGGDKNMHFHAKIGDSSTTLDEIKSGLSITMIFLGNDGQPCAYAIIAN